MGNLKVGDGVVRNPATWQPNEFDSWGRGIGIGVVVEPPFLLDSDEVDVRWPCGRCFESITQLLHSATDTPNAEPSDARKSPVGRDFES
jgi:hypothetical protein